MRPAVTRVLGILAGTAGIVALLSASAPWRERTYFSPEQQIGAGTVQSYVVRPPGGPPEAVGVTLTAGALRDLPAEPNTHSRCFDLDGDGSHTGHECIGDEERILQLPEEAAEGLPFQWLTVNWNPAGHPAPYNLPHFDVHFFAWERERIDAIAPGRCGELVDCADFERGSRPLPPAYLPPGHIDVGAVVPRMGNHLLDSRSPELADSLPFTRTFIYGAFDGELIFWEPMVTRDFLLRTRDACFEIRLPQAFRRSGYYPTKYCVRQDPRDEAHTVSLEGFVYAEARPDSDSIPHRER